MAPMSLHLHGQYSVARAFALEEYTRTTSFGRATVICVATGVPPLLGILLFDVVPLHDPFDGLERNGMVIVRLFGSTIVLTIGILLQLKADVPVAALSIKSCLLVSLVTSLGYIASYLLVAIYWVFPIPFGFFIFIPSWCVFFILSVGFAIGFRILRDNAALKTQLSTFNRQMNIASCFLPIYLVYNAVFLRLTGTSRLAWVMVLPVIKIILKRFVARVAEDQVDRMPTRVASVDVFNAMYQSKCMQTTGSTWITVAIIAIDVVQNVYSIRRLMHQMKHIEELTGTMDALPTSENILHRVVQGLEEPGHLDSQTILTLQARSCARLSLQSDKQRMVERIEAIQTLTRKRPSTPAMKQSSTRRMSFLQLPSLSGASSLTNSKSQTSSSDLHAVALGSKNRVVPFSPAQEQRKRARAIIASLDLVWKCELLLLVEYVEAAIPLLYAIYLSILYHLPDAKYYPGISEMNQDQVDSAVASILLYAGLEVASLVFVHAILKWKLNFSALHQLAFVFETDWALVQGMLLGWVVIVLQFTLVYYGTCMNSDELIVAPEVIEK